MIVSVDNASLNAAKNSAFDFSATFELNDRPYIAPSRCLAH